MPNIVITGASRGIGMATALTLGRAGHSVIATMRDPAGSPELGAISKKENLPVRIEAMDVDSDASVRDCFTRILAGTPVDVLVNNAGVERFGAVEETSLADFRLCMETNYFGAIRCIQAVARHMRERGQGLIINVSSVAGRFAMSPSSAYAASKFALEALSEALAQEMKPFGVRVAIVEPGITDTRMARNIGVLPNSPVYPQVRRVAAMFSAVLSAGAAPVEVVAQKIREIVENSNAPLRHPASPDASPFLAWRRAMSDEQWIDWGAADDASWSAAVKRDFGLDLKL
jgi:NAD(P)-dependent dehydrogenase (short-subunit alcohol dehydrogenase family)